MIFSSAWVWSAFVPRAHIHGASPNPSLSTLLGHSASHSERLFLCRVSDTGRLMIYPPVLMAGVGKPSGKEPAGAGLAVCYLWGFAGAASFVGAALAVVMGDGPTIGVGILSPRRPLTGCFWHDRGCRTRPGRPRSIVLRCRRRGFPGGGWCDEAVTGVMASRS